MNAPTRLRGLTWDHPRAYEGLESQTERFHQRHESVRLEWHRQSLREFEATPIAENAAEYDIIILDHPFMGDAVASGCLVDLAQIPSLADAIGKRNYVGRSLETYAFGGGQWALPIDAACQTAVYRGDRIAAADVPRCIFEVFDLGRKAGIGLAMACPHAFMNFLTLCGLMGADIAGTGDRLVDPVIGEEAVDTLRRLAEFLPPQAFDWSSIGLLEAMATTDLVAYCPMVFCFNSYARGQAAARQRLTYAALPEVNAQRGCAGSVIGGAGLAISSASTAIAAAADVIEYLTRDAVQLDMAIAGGQPAAASVWTDADTNAANGDFFSDCLETVQQAISRPRYANYMALQNRAGDLLREDAMTRSKPALRVVEEIEGVFQQTRGHDSR